ncbi:hypothetical protein ACFL6U_22660 [Planctomycetota bacterium]
MKNKQYKAINYLLWSSLLGLILLSKSGCKKSHEEERQKEEQERDEARQIDISQIESKYNAKYFPPETVGENSYTYEIQNFFERNKEQPIVFKAFLEDVVKTDIGIVVELLVPLSENFFYDNKSILFRLEVPEDVLGVFLLGERADPMMRSFRYFCEPDYYIVAIIKSAQRMRHYEINGEAEGDEISMNIDNIYSIISNGQLVNAVAIEKEE